MNAGKLRHQIIIKAPSTDRDEFGAVKRTLSTVATVRAAVKYTSSSESVSSGLEISKTSAQFKIRFNPNLQVTNTNVITFNGADFDVVSVIPNERSTELLILGVQR